MVEGRTASEAEAEAGLRKVIAEAKGRVAISCFSSNVARIQSIIRAAQANDRSVAVVGRAIRRAISAAQEVGYLRDLPDFVAEDDIELLPRENIVILCTGTQGEPRAAMAKIAAGTHESVTLDPGDTVVFSSRQIPGNEPAIARVQDGLIRRKIILITDDDAPVHVSGHRRVKRWPRCTASSVHASQSRARHGAPPGGACGTCRTLPGPPDAASRQRHDDQLARPARRARMPRSSIR